MSANVSAPASVSEATALRFSRFTLDDVAAMMSLRQNARSRACDFTVGGVFMWREYFRYSRCFMPDGTMIIRGVSQDNLLEPAFSLPLGPMPVRKCVTMLRRWADSRGVATAFSAIPEERVAEFEALSPTAVYELPQWADYIYDAKALATLTGKHYNKKRNHVNRFEADNPGYTFRPLSVELLPAVKRFVLDLPHDPDASAMEEYERAKVVDVINAYSSYPFEGGVLITPAHGIVAFTVGEVAGDTLHVHIEKMDHSVSGAGETINKLFAAEMLRRHPSIAFINRQDAAGDAGLVRAKESYRPVALLKKYNIVF